MKHTIRVLVLAMAVVTQAKTHEKGPTQGTQRITQVLIDLENKWVGALVKSDAATLDSIFADTYVDADEHSHRTDKQGVLSVLKSGELKLESISFQTCRYMFTGMRQL